MNRPPREHTERLMHTLRARIPGLVLRTTFISGFPGACKRYVWADIALSVRALWRRELALKQAVTHIWHTKRRQAPMVIRVYALIVLWR